MSRCTSMSRVLLLAGAAGALALLGLPANAQQPAETPPAAAPAPAAKPPLPQGHPLLGQPDTPGAQKLAPIAALPIATARRQAAAQPS